MCDVSICTAKRCRITEMMRGGGEDLWMYKERFVCTNLCDRPSTEMVLRWKTKLYCDCNGNVELMLPSRWLHKYSSAFLRITQGLKNG